MESELQVLRSEVSRLREESALYHSELEKLRGSYNSLQKQFYASEIESKRAEEYIANSDALITQLSAALLKAGIDYNSPATHERGRNIVFADAPSLTQSQTTAFIQKRLAGSREDTSQSDAPDFGSRDTEETSAATALQRATAHALVEDNVDGTSSFLSTKTLLSRATALCALNAQLAERTEDLVRAFDEENEEMVDTVYRHANMYKSLLQKERNQENPPFSLAAKLTEWGLISNPAGGVGSEKHVKVVSRRDERTGADTDLDTDADGRDDRGKEENKDRAGMSDEATFSNSYYLPQNHQHQGRMVEGHSASFEFHTHPHSLSYSTTFDDPAYDVPPAAFHAPSHYSKLSRDQPRQPQSHQLPPPGLEFNNGGMSIVKAAETAKFPVIPRSFAKDVGVPSEKAVEEAQRKLTRASVDDDMDMERLLRIRLPVFSHEPHEEGVRPGEAEKWKSNPSPSPYERDDVRLEKAHAPSSSRAPPYSYSYARTGMGGHNPGTNG